MNATVVDPLADAGATGATTKAPTAASTSPTLTTRERRAPEPLLKSLLMSSPSSSMRGRTLVVHPRAHTRTTDSEVARVPLRSDPRQEEASAPSNTAWSGVGGTVRFPSHVEHTEGPAVAALYSRHRAALYRHCLARTNDPALAEDIVQDTFLKLVQAGGRLDLDRPVRSLLVAMADRACIDAYRRRSYSTVRLGTLAASTPATADSGEAEILHRLEFERLQKLIAALPRRQRAALQLYAFEGLTYAEVAAVLDDSVVSVKSLLQRARKELRKSVERRLVAVVGGWRAWRARRHDAYLHVYAAGIIGIDPVRVMTTLVVVSTSVSMLVAALCAVAPSSSASAATGGQTRPGVVAPGLVHTQHDTSTLAPPADDRLGSSTRGATERALNEAVAAALPPAPERTPDNASLTTIEVSPAYAHDHTVFAAESRGPQDASALFVSRDGGASWHRPRALGFGGASRFLFPPGYPDRDRRFFALGNRGLQVSADGGENFETLLPGFFRDGAVSPGFASGDPSILLMSAGLLYEYHYDTGVSLLVQAEDWQGLKVDSLRWEATDGGFVIVLAGHRVSMGAHMFDLKSTFVARCTRGTSYGPGPVRLACESAALSDSQDTFVTMPRSPPTTSTRFVGHYDDISVSTDGGRTFTPKFRKSMFTFPELVVLSVETLPFAGPGSAVAAGHRAYSSPGPSLMRTDDYGATWTGIVVPIPGFARGSWALGAAPTGRVFATGDVNGGGGPIACSADGGRTWAPRCAAAE